MQRKSRFGTKSAAAPQPVAGAPLETREREASKGWPAKKTKGGGDRQEFAPLPRRTMFQSA
jgi:hypothetical protein